MQLNGAVRGVRTIPRRRRLNVMLAIVAVVVIGALVALMVWTVPLARSGAGAQDASPQAGAVSAVIHDDAGNMIHEAGAGSAVVHDDAGSMLHEAGVGSVVLHDDAGNMDR